MTVYSGTLDKSGFVTTRGEQLKFYKLNLVLLFFAVAFALSYVFLANFLVSQKYSLNVRRTEASVLNGGLLSTVNHEAPENLEAILLFAQKTGMIEARDINSIIQDRNFALDIAP